MRIFFLLLLLIALVYSCNRDTTEAVNSTAAATYQAPASAPKSASNDATQLGKADLSPAPGFNKSKDGAPMEAALPELGDPQEEKRKVSAQRARPVGQQKLEARQASATQKKTEIMTSPRAQAGVSVASIVEPSVFKISKTACYGNCKQYKLELHKGGLLVMEGKRNVRHEGWNTQRMMSFKYQDLMKEFQALTASELADVYPDAEEVPADLPATVLRFADADGQERTVRVYDLDAAPEPLAAFLQKLEDMVENGIWDKAVE